MTRLWSLKMSLPTQQDHQNDYESIHVTIPAMRGVANCTEIHATNVSVANKTHQITVDFKSLSPCGNDTALSTTIDGTDLSGNFAFWNDRSGDINHCPEYLVVAGNLDHMSSSWEPLALHCKPYLETIDARVELSYPDLLEIRTSAPSLNESSRRFSTTAEIPGIGKNLLAPYTLNSRSRSGLAQTVGTHYAMADIKIQLPNGTVDGLFGTIIQQGESLASLTTDTERLTSAVENTYRRVVVQAMNFNRVAAEPVVRSGTARLPNQLRLAQNGASTRALQALLAVMALSAMSTLALGSAKHVLPKNPRGIAAMASLLAGSSILEKNAIPPGSEWCGDEELRQSGLFKDFQFSMGWWQSGHEDSRKHGEQARFGIDVGTAEWYKCHE